MTDMLYKGRFSRRDLLRSASRIARGAGVPLAALAALRGSEGDLHAQGGRTIFATPLEAVSGANEASDPIRNIGQFVHVIWAEFPGEATAQSPIQVQMEFSRDGSNWRRFGAPITVAPVLDNGVGDSDVIAYSSFYGAFRAIRVQSVLATPGGSLLTVGYIGSTDPAFAVPTRASDRWLF